MDINWLALAPALTLFAFACVAILFAVFQPEDDKGTAGVSLLAVIFAAVVNFHVFAQGDYNLSELWSALFCRSTCSVL